MRFILREYEHLDKIPTGRATCSVTEGTLVLEGGGWRGLYTLGVLDALMLNGINLKSTVGISAGGLSGMGYVSGQIGWGAGIDLMYRHNSKYFGSRAFIREHGITGFDYLYKNIFEKMPLDEKMFYNKSRIFAVGATNLNTGKIEYFERDSSDIYTAVKASASVPFFSKPVKMGMSLYLDGACYEKIPFSWAKKHTENGKIVVVKTREWNYRYKETVNSRILKFYRHYPLFMDSLSKVNSKANRFTEELMNLKKSGEVFVIAPSEPVEVSKFEGNMKKLGNLYFLGLKDGENSIKELREYLNMV